MYRAEILWTEDRIENLELTRRSALAQTAFYLGIAGLSQATDARAQQPALSFPRAPRDRLAVTSWPFRAYMESPGNSDRNPNVPGMDMKEFPGFVVKTFQIHNINPITKHFASTAPAYLDAFRTAVEQARSRVVDLGLPGARFYDSDAAIRSDAISAGHKWIDMAVAIGSPSVRPHVSGRTGQKPDVELAAASLGKLAEYGGKRKIVLNLENDNPVAEDPFFLLAVIEKVNSPFLRALPDFGNSLTAHDAGFNERAVRAMLPQAWNMCHVKNVVEGDGGTPHTVNLKQMFELARASGYRGFYSMEFDTGSGDAIAGTKGLIQQTLQYLE
jgi:sugar phosphate isomerase/epimerase